MQDKFLNILGRYGDAEKLNHIRDMVAVVTEEVENKIFDEASTRPLEPDEIEFLRLSRESNRLKRHTPERSSKSVRFSPYDTYFGAEKDKGMVVHESKKVQSMLLTL